MWQQKLTSKFSFLGSSQDPEKVSRTLISIAPLISLTLVTFKLDIPQTEVETYLLAVASIVNGAITLKFAVDRVVQWWKQNKK